MNAWKKAYLAVPPTGKYIREDRCQTPLDELHTVALRPPIDLLYVAGALEKAGVECLVQDYPAKDLNWDSFRRNLQEFQPDALILSITTPTLADDVKAAAIAKEINPNIITICKGAHFKHLDHEAMKLYPQIDIVVRGEYEETLGDLSSGKPWHEVAGITHRTTEGPVRNAERAFIQDIDDISFPARHLIDNSIYIRPDTEELQTTMHQSDLSTASDEQIFAAADKVAKNLVYTIHTPVKAGHDRFNKSVYAGISHKSCRHILELLAHDHDEPHAYNFTTLAMRVNRTANSVSRLHRDVTHKQFPNFADKITAITNGVHHLTWISETRAELFDSFPEFTGWRDNPGALKNAIKLKDNKQFRTYLLRAWEKDSTTLYDYINSMLLLHRNQMTSTWIDPPNYYSNIIDDSTKLTPDVFTVGFARRFSTYKRADLIFDNIEALCSIAVKNNWPMNFLFSGKAHPEDEPGKSVIKLILD